MPDDLMVAAILLVAGPAIGTVCLFYPPFWRVWTVGRGRSISPSWPPTAWPGRWPTSGSPPRPSSRPAGSSSCRSVQADARSSAILIAGAVAYAIAGTLWCAVLAIRTRTTPALAALVAAGTPTEPAETLVGSVTGGLFASFLMTTGLALVVIGATAGVERGGRGPGRLVGGGRRGAGGGRLPRSSTTCPRSFSTSRPWLVGLALLLGWT